MTQLPAHIRPAQPADAAALADFINEAGGGLPLYFWTQAAGDLDPWTYGQQRAARDEGDFSWKNAHVIERSPTVLAMLLGFRIEASDLETSELPELVRPLVELEQLAVGSFYINALAVDPSHRGRGYGGELLALSHALAAKEGCHQISLQNFTNNPRARQLYQRNGFVEVARRPIPTAPGLPLFGESILHVRDVDPAMVARFQKLEPLVKPA